MYDAATNPQPATSATAANRDNRFPSSSPTPLIRDPAPSPRIDCHPNSALRGAARKPASPPRMIRGTCRRYITDRTAITRLAAVAAVAIFALVAAGPAASAPPPTHLSRARAIAIAVSHPEIARWLERYPRSRLVRAAEFDKATRTWSVQVVAGTAGEVASAKIDDATGRVSESLAGPQVAWQLAQGGGVGGKTLNRGSSGSRSASSSSSGSPIRADHSASATSICSPCSRSRSRSGSSTAATSSRPTPWSTRRSRTSSCGAPGLQPAGGAKRLRRVGRSGCSSRQRSSSVSFRIGLDIHSATIIDVGYAGVIGAQRLTDGRTPYGGLPQEGTLPACGTPDASGDIHERIQPNGHCERALPMGDTYGPVTYEAYIPGLLSCSAGRAGGIGCRRRASRRSCSTCWLSEAWPQSGGGSAATRWPPPSPLPGRPTRSPSTPPTPARTTR